MRLLEILGDEVLIIQDKLEAIKARYKDITKLSADVTKTLEHALQLAGQLQSTHKELCNWLDKVEVELLSYETQGLKGEAASQVQERQKVGTCASPTHVSSKGGRCICEDSRYSGRSRQGLVGTGSEVTVQTGRVIRFKRRATGNVVSCLR